MTEDGDNSLQIDASARQGGNNNMSLQAPSSTRLHLTAPQQADDVETAVAEFRRTYLNSSQADRAELRNINAAFANGTEVSNRLEQSRQGPPHFRFLDLPTEIRLMIVSYALAAERPLSLTWRKARARVGTRVGTRVGYLKHFEEAVALSRVSRQPHTELSPLIWKVNVFSFDLTSSAKRNRLWEMIAAARLFFQRLSPSQMTKLSLQIGIGSLGFDKIMIIILKDISRLALQLPNVHIKVLDHDWRISTPGREHYFTPQKYLQVGELWRGALQSHASEETRRWRICPWMNEVEAEGRKEALRIAGHDHAIAWIEQGI